MSEEELQFIVPVVTMSKAEARRRYPSGDEVLREAEAHRQARMQFVLDEIEAALREIAPFDPSGPPTERTPQRIACEILDKYAKSPA